LSGGELLHYAVALNPLSPNSDENEIPFEISLYIVTTCSNILKVMRIKEVITKDKMS